MPDRGNRVSKPHLGMTLAPASAELRQRYNLPAAQEGMVVAGVAAK